MGTRSSRRLAPPLAWVVLALIAACGSPQPVGTDVPGPREQPTPAKRITVAAPSELDFLHSGAGGGGRSDLRLLVNPGLSVLDDRGVRQAILAEAVPTIENGLWKVFPDGRMETTWRIREGARWHDGSPITSADLLFTTQVGQDREFPAFAHTVYRSIDTVSAPDARTVTVTWRLPYVEADFMFVYGVTLPMPRHLLEAAYVADKANFIQLAFWTEDYVGTGPYRVHEWARGSHVTLRAFADYVLGRPKIDEIEVRFIPDANALIASILAGSVDVTMSALSSIQQGITVRDGWREGRVVFSFDSTNWVAVFPQLLNPRPAVVSDVRMRRALLHAIHRQEMVDTLQAGLSAVAHSFMSPNQADYREIEARLPRYDYDPSRSLELIAGIGFVRGADGAFRDTAGERLQVEIRSLPSEDITSTAAAVADYWQRVGVEATVLRDSPQVLQDLEYRATFPAFYVMNQGNDLLGLPNLHSSRTRLPENRFQVPGNGNWSRYVNVQFDALIDRYLTTIPTAERLGVLEEIVHHIADQLTVMGLYHNPRPEAVSNRLTGASAPRVPRSPVFWNVHEWDLRR